MKKLILIIFAAAAMFVFCMPTVFALSESKPVYGENINDGTYKIEVKSSSSMFKIIDCELTVSEGKMTAVMTLSGKGYEKLFMGTGEEAQASPDSECIYFVGNSEGKYTYKIPVNALDTELDCAAWSIKKEKWYDRKIVFLSDTLPDGAVRSSFDFIIIIIAAAVCIIAAAAVFIVKKRRKR